MYDLHQFKCLEVIKTEDSTATQLRQVKENSSVISAFSYQAKKNNHNASELISASPKAKNPDLEPRVPLRVKVIIYIIVTSSRASVNMAKCFKGKTQNAVSGRDTKTKNLERE